MSTLPKLRSRFIAFPTKIPVVGFFFFLLRNLKTDPEIYNKRKEPRIAKIKLFLKEKNKMEAGYFLNSKLVIKLQ